ncbi:MAG: hypothetical protein PUC50_05230 [Bacteroidales bacterium]|nr:hypothetical protein [Bacteroidales bacterium]
MNRIPPTWKIKYIEDLHSITIPESSKPYITINKTIELDKGDEVSFSITDRTDEGLTATVTVQGTDIIETTQSGNDYTFTMPAEDVTISVSYSSTPINYTITTDDYSSAVAEASAGETVDVTFAKRDGYNLTSATYNGTALNITNNTASFTMPAANVIITTTYTKIDYTITADQYATPNKTTANVGDEISVTFANRDGYNLTSATYNGNPLTITNNNASFTMPAANVTIATTYTPIEYNVTAGEYVTANKSKATINDQVSFTVADRTADGYQLNKVLINNTEFSGTSFNMADYLTDVTITAVYSKIGYTITSDAYSTPNKTKANVGDEITVTFANRDGYNLTSATYNGNPLTITNNTASFTMPAANVTIATTYTKVDYTITADQYSTPNKTKANVGDEITVTFANRDGYNLTSAIYNGTALNITNNTASFTMPAANVTIATTYTKVDYTITADQYSSPNKTTANVGDEISVTFANRDGYTLTSATCNGTALNITNNAASFTMPAANVTIATTYTKIDYTITADQYSTPNKTTANVGDEITVSFANRDGYNLTSATYNGTALNISNNTASFTMPAANVTIATTYTKVDYTITADQYSTPNKTTANVGDEITVTFANRDGYNLTSATYNGTALTITNNTATFTMPAANVSIVTTYTPIEYNITAGEYVTANKSKATLNDQVSFTIADRTADDYQLDKVLINNAEISGTSFNMADYLTDVTITAVYSKIGYTITSDAYSTPSKTKANVGDEITVTFSKRDGYNLTSATYNGTALTIVDYKSQFTMPDEDVEIKTVYTVEQQQITKPEIITDNNVEITLPENLTENTEVTFTVQQKPGFTAFVYVNGVLTNEYKFVFTGKVEIKVDYKELTVSNISAETESYCAGDEINLTFATNPYAVEYELTFSNEAQKEGFENIDFLPVASYEQQPASFKIPQSAKPGKYHAFIRVKDSKDSHSKQYAFDFEVLYPTDIIETKYSDLICVNNSKNEYIGYQWFKDNKEIKGADKQFYIDAPMLNGSYSVALILKNGEKIRTCNYIVSNPTLKKSLKPSVNVYPNPANSSAPVVVELSEMDDLTDAYILIYNQLGVQIDKISNLSPHNTLSLKKGFYHGVVICGSTKLTFKIIVNE